MCVFLLQRWGIGQFSLIPFRLSSTTVLNPHRDTSLWPLHHQRLRPRVSHLYTWMLPRFYAFFSRGYAEDRRGSTPAQRRTGKQASAVQLFLNGNAESRNAEGQGTSRLCFFLQVRVLSDFLLTYQLGTGTFFKGPWLSGRNPDDPCSFGL